MNPAPPEMTLVELVFYWPLLSNISPGPSHIIIVTFFRLYKAQKSVFIRLSLEVLQIVAQILT